MGLVTAKLELGNPRNPSLAPIEVAALADTDSPNIATGILKRVA